MSPDGSEGGERPAALDHASDPLGGRDDVVAPFQIDGQPVRGRLARLGPTADAILSAHDYPEPVAQLLGEALLIAALIGASLKFDGKLIVQATGDGPVPLLVAHYETDGGMRGYAKVNDEALAAAMANDPRPGADALLGGGHLALTIDQGPDTQRYQSLAPLQGKRLADAASAYFESSEQVPTRLRLAVARNQEGDEAPRWRAGGAILQRLAPDEERGDTQDAWETALALFDTVGDDELADPHITPATLLFRLFHEEGVRVFDPQPVTKRCACSQERILRVLASFPESELESLKDDDGRFTVTCEYCNIAFGLEPDAVAAERVKGPSGGG